MDEAAKRRLVGAAVLVALAVIFVPMLVERTEDDLGEPIVLPEAPAWGEVADGDADRDKTDSRFDEPLPEPDDLLPLPLPTPEPPPSARDAEPMPADPRSVSPSGGGASSAEGSGSAARSASSTRRGEQGPGDTAALAPAGPKPVPSGTSAWVIQVASLGSPEAAKGLQDKLRGKGYPAFVEQADISGRRYYRVRVGPEIERTKADQIARQLAAETGNQPLVQRYR